MNNIRLVTPNPSLKNSFIRYYEEYEAIEDANAKVYKDMYRHGKEDFEKYLQFLEDRSKGIGVPEGWTASHTYWMVRNDSELLGIVRIRPDLCSNYLEQYIGHIGYDIRPSERGQGFGTEILRLALQEAKRFDLTDVLILCSSDNSASRMIILKNNGLYESNIEDETGEVLERYWIKL